ncbi:MAG: hypothetical protein WBZ29_00615 [Methanocella sp.]
MFFLPGTSKTGQNLVIAACELLKKDYPDLMDRAIVVSVPMPKAIHHADDRWLGGRLHGYAMCLNHWLRFLPYPVILINAEWLRDCGLLRQRYSHDVQAGYHPECDCPVKYIVSHEIGHYIYGRMGRERQKTWTRSFVPGKPSGYSTTPEEGFCEAFAGYVAGLQGPDFELVAALAHEHKRQ